MGRTSFETREQLQYICDILAQLRALAPVHAGPTLPYLLDMASLEASDALFRVRQLSETSPPG